jgi:hypothetical protein
MRTTLEIMLIECDHKVCEQCGMCSAYLAECENRANDEMGRVTTDRGGQVLHTECRRQIDVGYF